MALLAEEIVEEWLNRQGYFTIRGIKMGVQEIDLLAVQLPMDGKVKCRRSDKKALMAKLWNGEWSSELVVNVVKSEQELKLIAGHGIKIHSLRDIVSSLSKERFVIGSAAGGDIVDLIHISSLTRGGA